MSANRLGRINEEYRKELSEIIRSMKDPRIPVMTSVVAVNVTPDLRYAKIYVRGEGTAGRFGSAEKISGLCAAGNRQSFKAAACAGAGL